MTDALVAIRAEKAFAKLPATARTRVLAGLLETQRHIENERRYDRYGDRDLRLRNRDVLKAHLAPILRIIRDDVGGFDAMDWLTRFGAGYGLCQTYANEIWHYEFVADAVSSDTCPAKLADANAG